MKHFQSLSAARRVTGFTLIETILTIVIASVLAGMVAVFISGPVAGYVASGQRGDLSDEADLVLRRLSREVGLALPNSLRVTDSGGVTYIEFIPTSGGGAYRSETDGTSGNSLNFSDGTTTCAATASRCRFDVLGPMPASPAISDGDFIVVYNLGQDAVGNSYAPADAYSSSDPCTTAAPCNRAKVAASGVSGNTITLVANASGVNVFATQKPPLPSPSQRFHVVPGSVRAVTFSCPTAPAAGSVVRFAGYGFFATAAASIAALSGGTTLATSASCSATYTSAASQRNGLLSVTLTLSNPAGESVTLMRQIILDNSP